MFEFTCRHCGAPNSAEDKSAAAFAVCFNCGRMALEDNPPAKPRPKPPPPKPEPVRVVVEEQSDPAATWKWINGVLIACGWAACAIATLGIGLFFLLGIGKAQSAPQEASVAASCSFLVIAVYVLTRSFDKLLRD